ncbi:hypothetical protein SO802_004510 [Lithocarpus litseifolius]|uniref:Uncharacterized protein n=1 Tax=Lithocarpus litseifolius TaxID=425828 RepID=A0AAW2E447_9ROSI
MKVEPWRWGLPWVVIDDSGAVEVLWCKSLGVNSENFKFLKKMGVKTQHLQTQIHHNPTFKYHRTTMVLSPWPQIRLTGNRATTAKCLKSQDTIADLLLKYM